MFGIREKKPLKLLDHVVRYHSLIGCTLIMFAIKASLSRFSLNRNICLPSVDISTQTFTLFLSGVRLVVVGIGHRVDDHELSELASGSDDWYHVASYSHLPTIYDNILSVICRHWWMARLIALTPNYVREQLVQFKKELKMLPHMRKWNHTPTHTHTHTHARARAQIIQNMNGFWKICSQQENKVINYL